MDLLMQDTQKVTSEVMPRSTSVDYYLHSYLRLNAASQDFLAPYVET